MGEFHIWIHLVNETGSVNRKLEQIDTLLRASAAKETKMQEDIQKAVDALAAVRTEMAEQKTVIESVKTLVRGSAAIVASLKQQLADALANANSLSPEDRQALQGVVDGLDAVHTELDANDTDMANEVVANTETA